jgi:hypothetical protein
MPDSTKPVVVPAETADEKLGITHENLEGWVPTLASEAEVRAALEKAFDYRGDLTLTLKDGRKIQGYLFDRKSGPTLSESLVRILPSDGSSRISIPYSDIAALAFTGRDTAAGKSFAAWVEKYKAKKAAGETNIGIEPEPLD